MANKSKKGRENILVVVCYIAVDGKGARTDNERKYRIVQDVVERNKDEE